MPKLCMPGSRLSAYDPSSSFKTAGLEARVSYAFSQNTHLHVQAGWDRFNGDAADSPIVEAGSKTSFRLAPALPTGSSDLFR